MAGGQGAHLKIFWRKTLMEGPSQKIFKNGGWLCLTDAQRYYTTLQFWQVTAPEVYPGFLAHFSPYLVSYAGCGRDARDPRGICNNLGCTPLTGRIPDHWGDLPYHWRLRPGRWVWPHLTDNQLACTHNNPGYTHISEALSPTGPPVFGHRQGSPPPFPCGSSPCRSGSAVRCRRNAPAASPRPPSQTCNRQW